MGESSKGAGFCGSASSLFCRTWAVDARGRVGGEPPDVRFVHHQIFHGPPQGPVAFPVKGAGGGQGGGGLGPGRSMAQHALAFIVQGRPHLAKPAAPVDNGPRVRVQHHARLQDMEENGCER